MTIQAFEVGSDRDMFPEHRTNLKMIPRVLPNQRERFETEEIFKRNAQASEASFKPSKNLDTHNRFITCQQPILNSESTFFIHELFYHTVSEKKILWRKW